MLTIFGPVPFGLTAPPTTGGGTPDPGAGSLGSTQRRIPTLTAVPRKG